MIQPAILSERCYNWQPHISGTQRTYVQRAYSIQVSEYADSLISQLGYGTVVKYHDGCIITIGEWHIDFTYSETATKVIKRCATTRNGKRSTLPAFNKWLKDNGYVS